MKNVFRTCVLGAGIAAMVTASAFATTFRTEKVEIPFAFHVSKTSMPAGEYRVQQNFGSGIAFLVNLQTGQQVQVLRDGANSADGKAKLVFENTPRGLVLKSIH
jgi:hypothetical protein